MCDYGIKYSESRIMLSLVNVISRLMFFLKTAKQKWPVNVVNTRLLLSFLVRPKVITLSGFYSIIKRDDGGRAEMGVSKNCVADPLLNRDNFRNQESISPTYYKQLLRRYFCANKVQTLNLSTKKLRAKLLCEKAAPIMLVKLTPSILKGSS
jgi:hypothetical protein